MRATACCKKNSAACRIGIMRQRDAESRRGAAKKSPAKPGCVIIID
jgi:hypothetical protein